MSLSFYKINEKYQKILDEYYQADFITEELENKLNECLTSFEDAAINKYYAVIQLEHDYNAVMQEKKRLDARAKLLKEKIEKLESNIATTLWHNNIKQAKSPYFDLQPTESRGKVIIDDESVLDRRFFKEKVSETISLSEIHDAIKCGEFVKGAHIEKSINLKVKFGKRGLDTQTDD